MDIVNPDNPSTAKAVTIAPAFAGIHDLHYLIGPSYVSTTNTGKASLVQGVLPRSTADQTAQFTELDLTSLAIGALQSTCCQQRQRGVVRFLLAATSRS